MRSDLGFPLAIDRSLPLPMAKQMVQEIRRAIHQGFLKAGQRMPASRRLAMALGVSRTVPLQAYDQLLSEGYLVARHGSGTFVSADFVEPTRVGSQVRGLDPVAPARSPSSGGLVDLWPGQTDACYSSDPHWRRAWRYAVRDTTGGSYSPGAGEESLREQIAGYLTRARGFACQPECVLITGSSGDALDTVCRWSRDHLGTSAWVEDPGYPRARAIVGRHFPDFQGVPCDDDGLIVDALRVPRKSRGGLVYVTPSHQYPMGYRMSPARRLALIQWAAQHHVLIVEDDYNGEFRYRGAPLPAMYGLAPDHVAYLGTFSRVLGPEMRVGYLVAPPGIVDDLTRLREVVANQPPKIVQIALANYIASTGLERHVLRVRRRYARVRQALLQVLTQPLGHPPFTVHGDIGGLHLSLVWKHAVDDVALAERLAAQGLRVAPLSWYAGLGATQRGIVMGYSQLDGEALRSALERLQHVEWGGCARPTSA